MIAADTTVALGGEILNKPADEGENRAFIERLAGREHEVFTGHALGYGTDFMMGKLVTTADTVLSVA